MLPRLRLVVVDWISVLASVTFLFCTAKMATQGIIVAIGGIKHKFKPGTALSKIEAYFSKLGHASVVLTDSEGYAIVDDPVEPGEYVATGGCFPVCMCMCRVGLTPFVLVVDLCSV